MSMSDFVVNAFASRLAAFGTTSRSDDLSDLS